MSRYLLLVTILFLSSCGDDIIIPPTSPTPTPTPISPPSETPTPLPALDNPRCVQVMGKDGGGGFLWKPVSENPRQTSDGGIRRTLVVLLPGKFQRQFEKVIAVRNDGSEETLFFSGFSNYDPDGLRQTYRGDFQGKEYTGRVTAYDVNQECVWKVSNTNKRQD